MSLSGTLLQVTVRGKEQASVRHPTTGRYMKCIGERETLQGFVDFLEKGRNRVRWSVNFAFDWWKFIQVRPAYDGVVLLSHLPEVIPQLLKSLQRWSNLCSLEFQFKLFLNGFRWGLYNQFQRSVASIGDLSTYLSTEHQHRCEILIGFQRHYFMVFT